MKKRIKLVPLRLLMILISLMVIYPLLWNVFVSIKTNTEIMTDPWAMPQGIHIQNYINAFQKANMGDYFLNSLFVVIVSTTLLIFLALPITYAIVRYSFIGSKWIFGLYMACIFIQPAYILVPLFLQLNRLRMIDNLFILCIIYAVVRLPFTVFLLSGFLKSVPVEYEEAAKIDGCSYFGILYKIVMPLAKPGLFTVSLLAVIGFWNEYPIALTFITSEHKRTLPVGLVNLFEVQRYSTDWGALFAALIIVLVPTIIVYMFAQERLTSGLSSGGLKG